MDSLQFAINTFSSDWITPIKAFEGLGAKVLLESAYTKANSGRYSLLVINEAFLLTQNNGECFYSQKDTLTNLSLQDSSKDFLDWLEHFYTKSPSIPKELLPDFPLPLGGVGYLGYEFFSSIENIEFQKESLVNIPECAFLFGRDFLIFDRLYDEAHLVSINYENEEYDLNAHQKKLLEKLENLRHTHTNKSQPPIQSKELVYYEDYSTYEKKINFIQKEIYKGNLMQCVPSRKIAIKTPLPPLQAYRNLRQKNPSTYMFYLDFTDFVILGSSPEVMVKLQEDKEGEYEVILRPIAGTRKRGKSKEQDEKFAKELLQSPKENAEHLMLVDLGRNDVGRVCKAGSVKVTQFKAIEKYSRVMHIASQVCGKLREDKDAKDVIFATFPAGTVSGAAKIQAIKTLAHLEKYKRGVYAGMIGYFYPTYGGKLGLNSCIAIRTAVFKEGIYYLQAGAGIVYDSSIEEEFLETNNKLQSLVDSILGYGSKLEDLVKTKGEA